MACAQASRLQALRFNPLPEGWGHAITKAHKINGMLQQLFQFLLQVHQDIGSERIKLDPYVEIAIWARFAACDGTEETKLHHMKATSPVRLMQA